MRQVYAGQATEHERGGGLLIRRGAAERELPALVQATGAAAVYWASDATPYALARDRRVRDALRRGGVEAVPEPGNFVADIGKPRTSSGKPFTVFTPFHRAWSALERRTVHRAPPQSPALPRSLDRGTIPSLADLRLHTRDELAEQAVPAGESVARAAFASWLVSDLASYGDRHDRLAGGSSRLSPHLRFGFMRWLLDGDVAQNNGNWQWIASVGVDPAPAFRRLLNPSLQQRRHDPDGVYVRRWVPELRDVPGERLVEPWLMSREEQAAAGCAIGRDYPAPVVDHAQERRRALERYRAASAT